MNATDLLLDLAGRPLESVRHLRDRITPANLNAHPGGHDNSPAWLIWHMGREIDAQVAHLAGTEQLWTAGGYRDRLGVDDDSIGYGHTPAQARAVLVTDPDLLVGYLEGATDSLKTYVGNLTGSDLMRVIDERWDPPVTVGVRLISIIADATQHTGQLGYALGLRAEYAGA